MRRFNSGCDSSDPTVQDSVSFALVQMPAFAQEAAICRILRREAAKCPMRPVVIVRFWASQSAVDPTFHTPRAMGQAPEDASGRHSPGPPPRVRFRPPRFSCLATRDTVGSPTGCTKFSSAPQRTSRALHP
jgi:hypothetical protein